MASVSRVFSVPAVSADRLERLGRAVEGIFPLLFLGPVCLLFVPVPSWLIDVAVTLHIASGVFVFVNAFTATGGTQLSGVPALLLLSMFVRLSIEIASVRHVLAGDSPGGFIEKFGAIGAERGLLVGLVSFALLALLQLIGVSKGLERNGEIAAVFHRDEGAQAHLRINQQLQAERITPEEADRRHNEIEILSSLKANMAGAAHFVKGDATLSFVIIAITLLGGIASGILRDGLSFSEAIDTYIFLSIGTGLLSQLPCLLISFSAGISLTRVMDRANPTGLGYALVQQFASSAKALRISALALLILAFMPGVPALAFLPLSACCFFLPYWRPGEAQSAASTPPTPEAAREGRLEIVPLAPVVLFLSPGLYAPETVFGCKELFTRLRRRIYDRTGVPLASDPLILKGDQLGERGALVVLNGVHGERRLRVSFPPGRILLNESAAKISQLCGVSADPAHLPAVAGHYAWVAEKDEPRVGRLAKKIVSVCDAVALCLESFVQNHIADLLGSDEVRMLTDALKKAYPSVVDDVVGVSTPAAMRVSLTQLRALLARLLEEGVSIRNLRGILEAIATQARSGQSLAALTEQVRGVMKTQICTDLSDGFGTLAYYAINDALLAGCSDPNGDLATKAEEQSRLLAMTGENRPLVMDGDEPLAFSAEQSALLSSAFRTAVDGCTVRPVVFAPSQVRRKIWRVLRRERADVAVVGVPAELPSEETLKCKCIKIIETVPQSGE